MKLSKIKGDACFEVIADILEPISNIADDKDAVAVFKPADTKDGISRQKYLLTVAIPKLLKSHKNDLVCILAALSMKSVAEYRESMNLGTLTNDLMELLLDDCFKDFFTPSSLTDSSNSAGVASATTAE